MYIQRNSGLIHFILKSGVIGESVITLRNTTQDNLNFEKYLGTDLLNEFNSFRREDKYSNDNYISDGLSNSEIFKKAQEFIDTAEKEIYKSAELQHSISCSLKNLLIIQKFKLLAPI